ncbi:hypothetical protein ACH3VR_23310, partial [Microbacterium sp. B2969]
SFDLFYVLTNGGPYHSTEIPTTYLVQSVFHTGQVGYGSAMAVVLTAVVIAIGLIATTLRRRGERGERRERGQRPDRPSRRTAHTPPPAPAATTAPLSPAKELVR